MIAAIHLYPVKSLAGVEVRQADVEPWGLRHDRRWLVLEPDGTVLTAREEHAMLGVTATPSGDRGITLTSRDGSSLAVEAPLDGELVPTTLSRLESVRVADRDAHEWLSQELRRPVRLGWLDDPHRRTVDAAHGGRPGNLLTLADAGPLLLTARASLRQLNAWIAETAAREDRAPATPLVMTRFRPSVVVDATAEPFAEDGWLSIRLGGVEFRLAERCDRCVLTTIDPQSLAAGKEPLRTLALHRRWSGKTWFGIRLIPLSLGTIRVDDPIAVGARSREPASRSAPPLSS